MGRKRQLQFGAINITMPAPHRPERYIELFHRAGELDKVVKLKGDWVGKLGTLRDDKDADGSAIIRGEFYKYIELDSTRDWFNVLKGKPADERELDQISIPEHLKPHFQYVPFVFFSKGHRLVMIIRDKEDVISAAQAVTILRGIFASSELVAIFGKIDLVIEPSRDTLEKILGMPRLRTLEIVVTPPNPDDFEEFERDLFDDMASQRASSYQLTLQEEEGEGLAPSDKVRKLARVAQSNGKVSGVGGARGKTTRLSTTEHPLIEKAHYDPDVEIRANVLLVKAREILQQIRN
ncbi:DUF4747 family protein [uncultured Azonexus sp.]|uniref:DUF4747 family protein n=1 Tax=uncultured Azonexus sp. TaxID=520307 RepID=UPI00262F756E|nr:DUF4747 family protein [uncultured Azonexus sp.]